MPVDNSLIHVVWFKRDLRIVDHAPLVAACNAGRVFPLFCWEPSVMAADDYAKQHQLFMVECLAELKLALRNMGLHLAESPLGIIETLNKIRELMPVAKLYSHEETGNNATFSIDQAVANWCKSHRIDWLELPQNGVMRRLKNRNHWNTHWEQRMVAPISTMPAQVVSAPVIHLPLVHCNSVKGLDKPNRQKGGRSHGLDLLNSFLDGRASKFRGGISSPLSAVTAGSRLSPYLAFGCLSMREVVQTTRHQMAMIIEEPQHFSKSLQSGLASFESRLHWHCHFMQKLESEPELEFENLHHAHDFMRDELLSDTESQRRLQTWCKGETGWPLVDACMAMLRETGWINFRMRAMLMSSASYLYWLHWREPGLHLAREFLDYEPGIHWPQTQMQSGTTGINTLRIYNPIKQARDQDPTGAFVRHWLPTLKNVPDTWIFEPHLMPLAQQQLYGCLLDKDYPAPLVDIAQAFLQARSKIKVARQKEGVIAETRAVIKKHASRKGMAGSERDQNGAIVTKKSKKTSLANKTARQQELF